jgi:spore maturation protein CgeB
MRVLFLSEMPMIKYGLKCGFDQLGHITDYTYGEYRLWDKDANGQIQLIHKKINEFKPDLIFTEGYAGIPIEGIYDLCKRLSIPFFVWCVEDPVSTDWYSVVLSRFSDYTFTTTVECLPIYHKMGKPAEVLMFACNPEFHKPCVSEDRFKHDISLVGSNYSNRYDKTKWFVMSLIENNFDVMVYGNNWWIDESRPVNLINHRRNYWQEEPYMNGLPYEWLPIVINSSKIILGLNCDDSSETQMSLRPMESLASSFDSVYLAHYTKSQKNVFGDLIYQAKNKEETLLMAKEILAMTDMQRQQIAEKARLFVYEHHNYKLRAEQVIKAINKT